MSWMQKLYRTYEAVLARSDTLDGDPLTPIGHTLQNAHIVIVLNGDGEFQTARVMPPKTAIMLPATESSENRTSGEAPHPLADKLQYVAKDYADFGGEKKAYFEGYLTQLQAWCDSPFQHPKVLAVLHYVKKGQVIADLARAGVLPLDANGKVLNKWENDSEAPAIFSTLPKTKGEIEFGSALVCWRVEIPNDPQSDTWTDSSVQQSWADYLASADSNKGFCLVKGEEAAISTMHPAKLRHTGDKAKLISSNDTGGYTFRGRFETADEAATISAEVSAKAHSALRWLIARQGIRNGDQVTVAWAISGKEVPSPLQDPFQNFDFDNADTSAVENNAEFQTSADSETTPDWSANIGKEAANIIKKKYHGYKAKLEHHEQISLLMLDSATPGRMALTYYQEFLPKDYFANLDAWLDDFTWFQRHTFEVKGGKKNEKRTLWLELPPSPFAIAQAVYGKSLNDTLKKQLYARLLPVIAGGKSVPIPYDLVQKSFQVACNPHGCDTWEWQRNIGVACGLYRGWRARHHKESERRTYDMSLDIKNRSRDYLYGRLLAVAENIESYALYLAGEKRSTNAERYMQQFADRPYYTWRNLELALRPYQERLKNNGKDTGRQAISEIMELFATEDYLNDEKLSGEFLLGYHCQKMEIARQVAELKAKSAKPTEE